MYNSESDIYELICVSSELILNNYKREPNALEEELT
jgi:hypothetical protein